MSSGADLSLGPGSWHSIELPASRPRLSVHCQCGAWDPMGNHVEMEGFLSSFFENCKEPGLKESAFNDVKKKRGEDKAKDVKEDRRQAGIPKNKGPKGKAGSPRQTTAHSSREGRPL